jgi:hypothetical protein
MKKLLPLFAAGIMALALTPAFAASDSDADRMLKAPEKRMGDEGKLPATDNMSNQVPDMGAGTGTPADNADGPSGPKGPAKRMGDQGKLPATNNMSNQLHEMSPSSK